MQLHKHLCLLSLRTKMFPCYFSGNLCCFWSQRVDSQLTQTNQAAVELPRTAEIGLRIRRVEPRGFGLTVEAQSSRSIAQWQHRLLKAIQGLLVIHGICLVHEALRSHRRFQARGVSCHARLAEGRA